MKKKLKELKKVRAENCVTIIMTSHRTKPDYLKDSIQLKNLIKDAETRLYEDTDKRTAANLVQRLNDLADRIDHSKNIESLILFVNEDIAEIVRLPIKVVDRVVIDDTFATRDLFRSLHLESHYYILVLSQANIRLIEVVSDKLISEIGAPFPFENLFYPKSKAASAIGATQTNILTEFFNQADKKVNQVRKENPLPVFICGLEENRAVYLEVADEKHTILDVYLNKNMINAPAHEIVREVWDVMRQHIEDKNVQRKADLKNAVGQNRFLGDTSEIWRAIKQGRVQTLFVEQGRFQPGYMKDDEVIYLPESQRNQTGVIDDVYDEMIEANMDFGGDVVFLPKGELDTFNGFGAITRF